VLASYNQSHYYSMNVALNQAVTDDGWFIGGTSTKNLTSVKTSIDYVYIQEVNAMDWQHFNNAVISFKIFMDDKVEVVTRRTYKIADAMGDVGGFMGVVFIIGMIFVSNF
jgi:hypothetical protein